MTSVITEEQEMGQLWVLFSHPEIIHRLILFMGFPGGLVVKNSACQCRTRGFDPWSRQIPGRRKWQPTPLSCLGNPMDRGAWRTTQSMGLQRVGHDLATVQQQILFISACCPQKLQTQGHWSTPRAEESTFALGGASCPLSWPWPCLAFPVPAGLGLGGTARFLGAAPQPTLLPAICTLRSPQFFRS